jgi:transketolase
MSTGSLGHGLAFGAGIALGHKRAGIGARTYVLISDGECGEGSVWEAAMLVSRLHITNLMAILDYNRWQCFGRSQEVTGLEPLTRKWRAFGWETVRVDGHNPIALARVFRALSMQTAKPCIVIADTRSGNGVSFLENTLMAHYKVLTKDEYEKAREEIINA